MLAGLVFGLFGLMLVVATLLHFQDRHGRHAMLRELMAAEGPNSCGFRLGPGGEWLWALPTVSIDATGHLSGPFVSVSRLLGVPFARLRLAVPEELHRSGDLARAVGFNAAISPLNLAVTSSTAASGYSGGFGTGGALILDRARSKRMPEMVIGGGGGADAVLSGDDEKSVRRRLRKAPSDPASVATGDGGDGGGESSNRIRKRVVVRKRLVLVRRGSKRDPEGSVSGDRDQQKPMYTLKSSTVVKYGPPRRSSVVASGAARAGSSQQPPDAAAAAAGAMRRTSQVARRYAVALPEPQQQPPAAGAAATRRSSVIIDSGALARRGSIIMLDASRQPNALPTAGASRRRGRSSVLHHAMAGGTKAREAAVMHLEKNLADGEWMVGTALAFAFMYVGRLMPYDKIAVRQRSTAELFHSVTRRVRASICIVKQSAESVFPSPPTLIKP